ncbi:hypothetical protein VTN31DRAFT_1517 [Thermomyces dupontii]|uniref:uncharacterized protein n=1 Tax=Talaromyces thermophilus TaxID=28565 RepID=UPI003742D859
MRRPTFIRASRALNSNVRLAQATLTHVGFRKLPITERGFDYVLLRPPSITGHQQACPSSKATQAYIVRRPLAVPKFFETGILPDSIHVPGPLVCLFPGVATPPSSAV